MTREAFDEMLTGGHRNSLGRTEEVVELVLADRGRLDALFATLESDDEIVRMRAADALEKVCRVRPAWFARYADRVLGEVGTLEQPSVQWHVAQMLEHLEPDLSPTARGRAVLLLKGYLTRSMDWIVLNVVMEILTGWARDDATLAAWLAPELERLRADGRKSVAGRATKCQAALPA